MYFYLLFWCKISIFWYFQNETDLGGLTSFQQHNTAKTSIYFSQSDCRWFPTSRGDFLAPLVMSHGANGMQHEANIRYRERSDFTWLWYLQCSKCEHFLFDLRKQKKIKCKYRMIQVTVRSLWGCLKWYMVYCWVGRKIIKIEKNEKMNRHVYT